MSGSGYSNAADSSSSGCDRRLGRAAVRVLRGYLEAGLLIPPAHHDERLSLSEILQKANLTFGGDCPLSRDVIARDAELFGRAVSAHSPRRFAARLALPSEPYLQGRNRQNQQQRGQSSPQFYQCSLCGKTFVTRYYLDRHLERNHLVSDPSSSANGHCAADWCHEFLSLQACHDVALEHEPYYGPGSGEHAPASPAASKIKHSWFQQAHGIPCRDSNMQMTQARCRTVVESCFPSNNTLSIRLEQHMCSRLSCHYRLYRIFQKSAGIDAGWNHGRSLASEWEVWNGQHHRWGVLGAVVLVLFVVVYAPCATMHWVRQRRLRQQRNPFSTLPSRRTSSLRKSISTRSAVDPKKRL